MISADATDKEFSVTLRNPRIYVLTSAGSIS